MHNAAGLLERLPRAYGVPYRAGDPPLPKTLRTPEGLALSYLDWGGGGDGALFLHGGALTAHTWDLVCLALRDKVRCVAMDLRGHGLSAWSDEYSIDAHVSDVAAAIAHLGLQKLHIVGMSLG